MDAQKFRDAIRAVGLQQAQLARLVDVHPSNVQRWARGQARVPGAVEVILLVLQHTDLTHEDLLGLLS